MPVDEYYVRKPTVADEKLIDIEYSNDVPLKHTRNGWLRFCLGVKPVQRVNDESDVELANRKMEIELDAIDKYGTPHRLKGLPQSQWIKNEEWGVSRVFRVIPKRLM